MIYFVTAARLGLVISRVTRDILFIGTQSRFSYQKVYSGYTLYQHPEQVQLSEGLSRIYFVSAPRVGLVIRRFIQDILIVTVQVQLSERFPQDMLCDCTQSQVYYKESFILDSDWRYWLYLATWSRLLALLHYTLDSLLVTARLRREFKGKVQYHLYYFFVSKMRITNHITSDVLELSE